MSAEDLDSELRSFLAETEGAEPPLRHDGWRILLVLQDLESSRRAIAAAVHLAAGSDDEVEVFHVRELPVGSQVSAAIPETPDEAATLVDHVVLELREQAVHAHGRILVAPLLYTAKGIMAEAESFAADVIVLESHRTSGLLSRLFEGVAQKVVRESSCLVLLVP